VEYDSLALALYRREVFQLPKTSSDIKKARQGDKDSREAIIHGTLGYILTVAHTYHIVYPEQEYSDLVSIGNLAAVECLDHALTKRVPYSYLRGCIKNEIHWYCVRHRTSTECGYIDLADCSVLPPEKDYAWLYEVVDRLPEDQKNIVRCHFGLGVEKRSLYELSRHQSTNVKGTICYMTLYKALRSLRRMIA
jgi:hypothetical protein